MLAFQIVEVLVHLFPDPTGPLASYAADLFENLSCYFPIHFMHVRSVLSTYLVSCTSGSGIDTAIHEHGMLKITSEHECFCS